MRYKKISPKNNKWKNTCQALKELFETLCCYKCKSSLHDSQQFLQCGHFSCLSCIKNSNKCIECQFSVNDDILKDDTIKKIVQACCTIAEQVGFKKIPSNVETTSVENLSKKSKKHSHIKLINLDSNSDNTNEESNHLKEKPEKILEKRKGVKNLTEIISKKAKLEKIIPTIRIPKNVEKKNHHGETKLQEECKKGHIDNVKILLDAGADPNTHCAAGWTPLQECADFGFIGIAKLLLKKGADINKKGYQGRTPLHEATQADQQRMVKFLLDNHAQKEIEDDNHNKPIEYCKSEGIKMLLKGNNNKTHKRFRKNNLPQNNIHDISGVSNNVPEKRRNVSATNYVTVENEYDSSSGKSEDNEVPNDKRHNQNSAYRTSQEIYIDSSENEEIDIDPPENEEIDIDPPESEEIDIMN